ncbi:MAG: T9SS type A sorting domain-containing protein [Bacteroidetes bacterium]|nr:T9SS type A sorting domain-containing protein [Bacteroidota bacterium]
MKTLLFSFAFLLTGVSFAQNTTSWRMVFASAGRVAKPASGLNFINNKVMTYTIGEPIIHGGLVGTRYIHNGFEQPDKIVAVSPGVVLLEKPNSPFKIYPNPANDYSIVEGPEEQQDPVRLQLIDMNAKLIAEYTMESTRLQIDFENTLAPGTYFLNFYSNEGQFIQQNKLIKQ